MTNQTYDHTSPNNNKVIALQDISSASEEEYSDQVELSSTYEKKRKYAGKKKDDKVWNDVIKDDNLGQGFYNAKSRNCDNASENIKIKWRDSLVEKLQDQ
ncbi:842_t:CDS:2 [Racocetra persica]|uniref:842_t:CDS:1 n=1 Tax=Racocetra persica TaxID=160502 RepID=A0ACA9L240_9GLOM|nr:842_t:CDS:2 [Racocetra persica]